MSFSETKALIENFNQQITEFKKRKAELAKKISVDFAMVIEGYLKEFNIPYVFMKGTLPWRDGDETWYTLNTEYGYEEEGIEWSVEILKDRFPTVDFSNILKLIDDDGFFKLDTSKLQNELSQLQDFTEEAFGKAWEIQAAYDVDGKFHYYFGDCYDEY